MKKLEFFFILIITLSFTNGISQENNEKPKIDGITFYEINPSECLLNSKDDKLQNLLLDSFLLNDTVYLRFKIIEECCLSINGSINLSSDTLRLNYSSEGEPCECECCYNIEFKIILENLVNTLDFAGLTILENGEMLKKRTPDFLIIENDTINYIDEFGRKQGVFISFDHQNDTSSVEIYSDGYIIKSTDYYPEKGEKIIFTDYGWNKLNIWAPESYERIIMK